MLEISNDVNLVKEIKRLKVKNIFGLFISIGVSSILLVIMIAILIINLLGSFILPASSVAIMNLFVQGNLWYGRKVRRETDEKLKSLSNSISDEIDSKYSIYSVADIKIIPKNLKLGEDLSHNNLVQIFKEGHYVLVHGFPQDIVIRQYIDEDELHVEVLDEEDKKMALSELSEDENVKKLTLWNNDIK